jgi:cystine transport system substrate-binding protein
MRKLLSLLVVVLVVTIFAACGSKTVNKEVSSKTTSSSVPSTLLDKVKSKGEITIGTTGTYPPYTYHDDSNKLTGFDIEIAAEVAKRLGVKATFVEASWDGILAGLDSGRFDFIVNQVAITDERKLKYDFTDFYEKSYPVLIVPEDNTDIKSYDDLKGKKVNTSETSTYGKDAKARGAVLVLMEGDNIPLLQSKRIDAILNDSLYFATLKKTRPDIKLKVVDKHEAALISIPTKKGNPEFAQALDKAIKDMKADGKFTEISKKWFGVNVLE